MCRRGAPAGYGAGQPILPATGEKYREEIDYDDSGPDALSLTRIYRSTWASDPSHASTGMGQVWTHNHGSVLKATPSSSPNAVIITSAEGYVRTFVLPTGSSNWSATNSADTLLQTTGGGWSYRRADDDSTLTFDASGKLLSASARNGWTRSYAYNAAGRLATITNGFGRSVAFAYNGSGQLTTVTTPDARVIGYAYDSAGRLSLVTYPDGKTRSFAYENASFPQALTGIFDESGARWGTFAYDAQGRATTTELAGAVNRYQVSYPAAGTATVIDPLSTSRNYSYGTTKGKLAVTSGSLPSGTGESDAASRVQDANGLITSETDFKGVRTDTTWDVARRLPISVTRAVGTPEAQTVTTQWHPTFSLPVLVIESGRTTAYTYDDKGNVLSQAITDTASSPNATHTWSWTWNAQGLAATETAPNGAVTTFEYDALGNLVKSTNALGHVTQYAYDSANRLISTTAPNGVVSTYTWDLRDRLLTQTVDGQGTTTLSYKPTGLVETLTLPTGLSFIYTYDAAHRLTGWSNNRGESGAFTLDAMGNRVGEQTRDSTGAVAWMAARSVNNLNGDFTSDGLRTYSYDAEGRLSAVTTGATDTSPTTRYAHNALGQRVFKTEPLYPPAEAEESNQGFMQSLISFFTKLWGPSTSDAEKQGFAFMYDEDGTLLAETGTGGANSAGSTQYIYLPTASGPVPVATVINGQLYAVHSDHLNTPRRLTDSQGQAVWQWAYSAFGEEKPSLAKYRFANLDINPNPGTTNFPETTYNVRYPNHYADGESGLFDNRNRFYSPPIGRYTQGDAFGWSAGPNRFIYALDDPLGVFDDDGLEPKKPNGSAPAPYSPLTGGTIKPSPIPGWKPAQVGAPGGARLGGAGSAGAGRGIVGPICPPEGLDAAKVINPNTVRFSQDSAKAAFSKGGSIQDMADALRSGALKADQVPPIRLVEKDGQLFTLDNRRLEAFRRAGVDVPYTTATPEEVAKEAWKFTTKNDGRSIQIRGE